MRGAAGWLGIALLVALVSGALARVTNVERKLFFQDEAYSALRITGHTQAAYLRSFDASVRPVAAVRAFQRLDAASSPAATLASIAREEPQRGPLYYALAALWVRFAGTSIGGFRSLSVWIGLLEIASAYALGRAFFENARTAALLAGLVAVSPFHVRYAQQAREYGLFGLSIFAATAALARALRGGRRHWCVYAFAGAAGLATSPLFALVILSHAAYVAYVAFGERALRDVRPLLTGYVAATAAAGAALLPWFAYAARSAGTVADQTEWATSPYPAAFALTKWIFNVGATFFDYEFADVRFAVVLVVLLPLAAVAFARTFARERCARALVLALALPTLLAFLAKDSLSHAHFATIPRYLTPLWIALEIAVAAGLASGLRAPSRRVRGIFAAACGVVLGSGVWCAAADSRAVVWWDDNDNEPTVAVASVINAAAQPLVATSNVAITLSLVHYLRSAVRVQLYPRDALPAALFEKARRVHATYLFLPSLAERATLLARGVRLTNVGPPQTTVVNSFHAALQRDRPGPHSRSLAELSQANALWQIATGTTPVRVPVSR